MEIVLNRHLFKEKPLRGCLSGRWAPCALCRALGQWQEQLSQAGMAAWVGLGAAASSAARQGSSRDPPAPGPPCPGTPLPHSAAPLVGERLPPALLAVLNYRSEEALGLYCFHLFRGDQCLFCEAAIWSNRGDKQCWSVF